MIRCLAVLTLFLSGCASSGPSLYGVLGEKAGIEQIADYFLEEIERDRSVGRYFEYTDMQRFREQFVLHLCETVGGPCHYEGEDMVQTHIGLQITERDFNQTVDLLINAMDRAGVAHTTQNRVIAELAPMRRDIIYK